MEGQPLLRRAFRAWPFAAGLVLIIALWAATVPILDVVYRPGAGDASEVVANRGQRGDAFGAINALFSGLAFFGVVVALLLQREDLSASRQERKIDDIRAALRPYQEFILVEQEVWAALDEADANASSATAFAPALEHARRAAARLAKPIASIGIVERDPTRRELALRLNNVAIEAVDVVATWNAPTTQRTTRLLVLRHLHSEVSALLEHLPSLPKARKPLE